MNHVTRIRAIEMMRDPLVGSAQSPKHIPFVYVVGDKLFFLLHAAEAWKREVAPQKKIEVVSITEAFGVTHKEDLPDDMAIMWNINQEYEQPNNTTRK